jgi:hypothetical protein
MSEASAWKDKWQQRTLPAVVKRHRWNEDGEKCLDCGDSDWMCDPVCKPRTPPAGDAQGEVTDVAALRALSRLLKGIK